MVMAMHAAAAESSQFIENLPPLSHDPDRAGAMRWQKPDYVRSDYSRVMIEPVTLFISPVSKSQGLKADELKYLSDRFSKAITQALEPEIPIVSKKGAGVLYVRTAITNVKLAKKQLGLLGYTPIALFASPPGEPPFTLEDASLEIEVLDSMSGERISILIDKMPNSGNGQELTWSSIDKTLSYYAERFKARLKADLKSASKN